jgi:hypothetical protein
MIPPRSPRLIVDAAHARARHHTVSLRINTPPRKRSDNTREAAVGETSCGRNARKNSVTFGFSKFVRKPAR